jgi:hypothetical protein
LAYTNIKERVGLMKNLFFVMLLSILSIFTFAGCEVIGGIFRAGMWVGILIVVIIVAIVFWILKKIR